MLDWGRVIQQVVNVRFGRIPHLVGVGLGGIPILVIVSVGLGRIPHLVNVGLGKDSTPCKCWIGKGFHIL